MRDVRREHVAGQRTPTVHPNTGIVFTSRQQAGHRGHVAVGRRRGGHAVGGGRVRQTQPHAHRESRRQRGDVRASVRPVAVLSDHVCARSQTHRHCLRRTKVSRMIQKWRDNHRSTTVLRQ